MRDLCTKGADASFYFDIEPTALDWRWVFNLRQISHPFATAKAALELFFLAVAAGMVVRKAVAAPDRHGLAVGVS